MSGENADTGTTRRRTHIESDDRTVWVHASDGSCIGRFGWMGVDIHRPFEEQTAGVGECLCCTHGPTGIEEWRLFVTEMKRHHDVDVSDRHMPQRLRGKQK